MRLAVWVAYDGSQFRGFAPNDGVPTVTGRLVEALGTIFGELPTLTCAGRTDAGVHGRGQCITFDVSDTALVERGLVASDADFDGVGHGAPLDVFTIERSLNGLCRPAIVAWHVAVVPQSFDARFSARSRTYRYRVLKRRLPDPVRLNLVWHVWEPLELGPMREAARVMVGTHDFSSFCRRKFVRTRDGEVEATRMRTVVAADWHVAPGDSEELVFVITATSFCQQMVRSIVGTSVDVGCGRLAVEEIPAIMAARDRGASGRVAPPHGLTMWEVDYERTPESDQYLPPLAAG